ncbi:MAG: hypothetical protein HY270_13070 [Deltaproteobacteria bacterium]|nr:hypothetical protein [Deltaproteobacteria bacterium]
MASWGTKPHRTARTRSAAGGTAIGVALTCLTVLPARFVGATPTPTSTPTTIFLQGSVLGPGSTQSLVPAAGIDVAAFGCPDTATCLRGGSSSLPGFAVTNPNGQFQMSIVTGVPTQFILSEAVVSDVPLRTIATSFFFGNSVTIDPISEAAVRLIDEHGLQFYDTSGVRDILAAVRSANAATDFHGLSVDDAVTLARSVANGDAEVQRLLATRMMTPTFTRTVTPTPTRTPTRSATPSLTPTATPTVRFTATPRSCVGDCDYDGEVTIDELIAAVNIVLDSATIDACRAADGNGDGQLTVDEVIDAVNNALTMCSPRPPAPDLIPSALRVVVPPGCAPLVLPPYVEVCVLNIGAASAGAFGVGIGQETVEIAGVSAGQEICAPTIVALAPASLEVVVDVTGAVPESRRDNNQATFDLLLPPPQTTCTPTVTPTPSPSPTPT